MSEVRKHIVFHGREQGISIRYTGGLVRITCGTAGENRAVLTKMADYFAAVPAKGE